MKKLVLALFSICLLLNSFCYCQEILTSQNDSLFIKSFPGEVNNETEELPFELNIKHPLNDQHYQLHSLQSHTFSSGSRRGFSGALKGALIGGGIGLLPIVAGQGGGYVAIITFPVGLITGAIIGGTSKKKHSESL